jgi:Reductase C-terminal
LREEWDPIIAGLAHGVDQWIVHSDPATRAFSTFGFRDGKLAVVESVNHAAVKRIIGTTKTLTPEEAADPGLRFARLGEEINVERHGIVIAQRGSFLVSDSHSNLGV